MIDYVKCLECGTEKTREDTFLDIPLPVKPFGSNAYNSVVIIVEKNFCISIMLLCFNEL